MMKSVENVYIFSSNRLCIFHVNSLSPLWSSLVESELPIRLSIFTPN